LDRFGSSDGLLLAIPVFNEERYVDRVLAEVRRFVDSILVIDDGSTDRTPRLLAGHGDIRVITHAENRGYGKSLADAFAFAERREYRWLITMDCDEQHKPSYIPQFADAAAADAADIISGTRYGDGYSCDASVPPDRREINRRITAMLNRRLGLNVTDAFCGFKAYRVSALRRLEITVPGYAMPMQLWVQAARAGLRVVELPVRLIYHDPTRHFGGMLDDPALRLAHYVDVFEAEVAKGREMPLPVHAPCAPCR